MHRILPHYLWIGHAGDGRDLRQILDLDIKAIIQLAFEEAPLQPTRELVVERYPLLDGTGNSLELLRLAIRGVVTLIEEQVPALVCCGAGMSRSPAIVAAAISILEQQELEHCMAKITEDFPADVSPGLWKEVSGVCRSWESG